MNHYYLLTECMFVFIQEDIVLKPGSIVLSKNQSVWKQQIYVKSFHWIENQYYDHKNKD